MSADPPLVIDTHNHYWVIGRSDLYWLDDPSDPVLGKSYLPPDLKPHMDAVGVDRSLIVQAAHAWHDQLEYLELCERYAYLAGVIAWVDLADPGVGDQLDRLAENRWYRGVRAGAEDQSDPAWLTRADVRRGIRAATSRGHIVELLVKTPHLPHVPQIARENEGAKVVIDHLAKPPFESGDLSEWRRGMLALAEFPHLRIKISGLLTEAPSAPSTATIRPAVDLIVDNFAIERLLWGSDWPVALRAASYADTFARVTASLDRLSAVDRAAVLGGNAQTLYEVA